MWANQGGSFIYTVSVNDTARCNEDKVTGCVKAREQYLLPLKLALDSAFARIYGGPSQIRFKADVAIMPHPTEESSDGTKVAFQLRYGALFFCECTARLAGSFSLRYFDCYFLSNLRKLTCALDRHRPHHQLQHSDGSDG